MSSFTLSLCQKWKISDLWNFTLKVNFHLICEIQYIRESSLDLNIHVNNMIFSLAKRGSGLGERLTLKLIRMLNPPEEMRRLVRRTPGVSGGMGFLVGVAAFIASRAGSHYQGATIRPLETKWEGSGLVLGGVIFPP